MSSLVARDLRRREVVHHRWSLVEGLDLPLGRAVQKDQLQTGWDDQIAGWHAIVRQEPDRLIVKRRSDPARHHAIFYDGQDLEEFVIVPGEGFVIGTTIFQLEPARSEPSESGLPSSSRTVFFNIGELRTQLYSNNEHLTAINALMKQFHDHQLNLDEFENRVLQTLRQAVRRADYAAILHVRDGKLQVNSSDGRLGVCQPLVQDAIHKQMLVEHRWGANEASKYPTVAGAIWAVCAPIVSNVETEGDYAIYLSGAKAPASGAKTLRTLPEDQLSLVAIVADMLQWAYTLSDLTDCRKSMEIFFPKRIRDLLVSHGPSGVFHTEEVQAAILFCDLRGSSQFAEKQAHDLTAAWERIKEALSIMTEAITNQDGSVGDFQGDAAMGFWGWPRISQAKDRIHNDVHAACQAAEKLRERFQQKSRGQGPLAGFACGIGLAAGPVVAGVLGTVDQRKIGVFGPAVNLAARLESMTKQLGASILIDEEARKALSKAGSDLESRLRFLAAVQPVGMDASVRVFELMPPPSESALTKKQLKLFDYGRDEFEKGNWKDSAPSLKQLASAGDGPSKFLVSVMERLQTPPKGWNGSIVLTAK